MHLYIDQKTFKNDLIAIAVFLRLPLDYLCLLVHFIEIIYSYIYTYVCSGQFVIRGFSREYKTYMERRIYGNWEFD